MKPPYVGKDLIAARLAMIFPPGTPNRGYCTRDLAASTVFAALYIGAVEGVGPRLGPVHVYRMTDEQAEKTDSASREAYATAALSRGPPISGRRWYADNTREPIRDETLRDGLVSVGAVVRRDDIPTTSSKPRYALKADFAALFDPSLDGDSLVQAVLDFQRRNLSKGALARISILRAGAADGESGVLVRFPNDETRRLAPGPSSVIAKAVVETFAPRFLAKPAVIWLSESGDKVVHRDDLIASSIGLHIDPANNLPDLILADLGPGEPLIVFVEVVATDGAVTERRRDALLAVATDAGFASSNVAFVTAFLDRLSPGYRKASPHISWGSLAWFVSEPEHIVLFRDRAASTTWLGDLLHL